MLELKNYANNKRLRASFEDENEKAVVKRDQINTIN